MKNYKYRLEPLLRLREQKEREKQRVVGALAGDIAEQQRQALEMASAIRQEGEALKDQHSRGEVDVTWMGHYLMYVSHMQQGIQKRIHTVGEIQKKLAVARQDLAEAAKEKKILEKLKEKQRERFLSEAERYERGQMDEMSTNRYLRGSRAASMAANG